MHTIDQVSPLLKARWPQVSGVATARPRTSPLVECDPERTYVFLKRSMDIAIASVGLILCAPLFLAISLWIRCESSGGTFFRQRRVGRDGRPFSMLKFRSMSADAESRRVHLLSSQDSVDPLRFKLRQDPRVTRSGRFLRRYSLDELPQLWNVLVGDMSLVGPRPPIPEEVAQYDRQQWKRLAVEPGLTCFWQTQGRADVPFEQQVALDLDYIARRSIGTDLRILCATIPAVLGGRGAY